MRRLFVAVRPPSDVLDQVASLSRPDIGGLRWTGPEQWHVTLRFLGPVADVEPVVAALVRMAGAGNLVPATAVLGPEIGRFGQRVLHVPVRGLDALAGAVGEGTASLGRPPDDRPFSGHLTLARVAKDATVDLRPLAGGPVDGVWDVGTVGLVESHLSLAGARYEVLEEFPLRPPLRGPVAGAGGPVPPQDGGRRRTS